MEINHEEFVTILKEKDKYEKMNENLRSENEKQEALRLSSVKSKSSKLNEKQSKIIEYFIPSKNFILFLRMYKMVQISKKGYRKCEVEIIDKGRYFWVNRKDLEVKSDVTNRAQIFHKCDPEKQKYRQELMPNAKYQRCRVFVRNDLVERKNKSCRKSSKKT